MELAIISPMKKRALGKLGLLIQLVSDQIFHTRMTFVKSHKYKTVMFKTKEWLTFLYETLKVSH